MPIHKPKWFSDDYVMVSTAPTCGLTKGGRLLKRVDKATGKRIQTKDPETGAMVDAINDQLLEDMSALAHSKTLPSPGKLSLTDTLTFIPSKQVSTTCAVPVYYDRRFSNAFREALATKDFEGFEACSIGELLKQKKLLLRGGHGSPSQEQRVGEVPYIKVSDLRAGLVNINPTNRVPRAVAEKYWHGKTSGLRAFDLVSPERTSKNIGDFCVLMPGQEQVLMTKEVIVLRPGPTAEFDAFYLLWALTLRVVRDQWRRVVFMQTNREDVGSRFLEIEIPVPPNAKRATKVSEPFRRYFNAIATARQELQSYLATTSVPHHFFVSGGEVAGEPDEAADDENAA